MSGKRTPDHYTGNPYFSFHSDAFPIKIQIDLMAGDSCFRELSNRNCVSVPKHITEIIVNLKGLFWPLFLEI